MKVLTMKQPWATLIVEGYKKYEFRTWKTSYRGEFLIHAGLGIDNEAMERFKYLNLKYPKGCIIGKAILEDCILVDKVLKDKLLRENNIVYHNLEKYDFKKKKYGFKLTNIEKIDSIPAKGKLSFWNYNYKKK